MENRETISKNAIVILCFTLIFVVAFILTLTDSQLTIANELTFWASIVTTLSAIILPLFSVKRLKLTSFNSKLYSLIVGIIILLVLLLLDWYGIETIEPLREYSNRGTFWALNTALLFFMLFINEIDNRHSKNMKYYDEIEMAKNKEIESILEKSELQKKLIHSELKNKELLQSLIEKNRGES